MLARNDANKKLLVDLGALEPLVELGQTGNEDEQCGRPKFEIKSLKQNCKQILRVSKKAEYLAVCFECVYLNDLY